MNKVTDLLALKAEQKNLDFANVCIDGPDNRLYLDALLIWSCEDELSKRCTVLITDFFDTVFNLFKQNKIFEVKQLLNKSHENNSVRLGKTCFTRNSNGKGCTQAMLYKLFKQIHTKRLVEKGLIADVMDTVLFIKGFDEDRMSDLLLSIIFSEMVEFTNKQANLGNTELKKVKSTALQWNMKMHQWEPFEYEHILDFQGNELTLLPKWFLTGNYVYRADRFIHGHLMEYEQNIRYKEDKLKYGKEARKTNKKELYKELQDTYGKGKEFAINYTLKYPELIANYRENRKHGVKGSYQGSLTDSELTEIIDKPYKQNIG